MFTRKRFIPPLMPKLTGDWKDDGPKVAAALNDVLRSFNDFLLSLEEAGAITIDGAEIIAGTGNIDLNGNDLIIDADGDSYLHEVSDDVVALVTGGTERVRISSGFDADAADSRPNVLVYGNYGGGIGFQDTAYAGIYSQNYGDTLVFFTGQTSGEKPNANQRLFVNSTGVGIGASPSYKLHIGSGQVAAPDGSNSKPSYSFASSGNADTGAYLSAGDTFAIASAGHLAASVYHLANNYTQLTVRNATSGLTSYASVELIANSATGRLKLRDSSHISAPGTIEVIPYTGGSVYLGAGAVSTSATNGFTYVPSCAGTPTGTPTTATGLAPIVVDTTNHKLYFYSGGSWRDAGP